MGYDFTLMRLNDPEVRQFPLSFDQISKEDTAGKIPWAEFRRKLIANGGKKADGDRKGVILHYDQTSIQFHGDENGVYLDVHAGWGKVLEAYELLKGFDRNCGIFDLQTGLMHNSDSFREFIKSERG